MLSKSQLSFIKSLQQKKYRKEHSLFVVEGIKSITEFLQFDYEVDTVYCLADVRSNLAKFSRNVKLVEVSTSDLERISGLSTPQKALALVRIPEKTAVQPKGLDRLTLLLDGIQDPGNLGTIIRTADWFGFKQLICSPDTVEPYNPKVVQATMGSLSRVTMVQMDLAELIENSRLPVYGALLEGESIYETSWPDSGFILLGNEGHGIRPELIRKISHPVTIPRFGQAESLNVAISAAIFCSEIKRNQ